MNTKFQNPLEALNFHMLLGKNLYNSVTSGEREYRSLDLSEMVDFLCFAAYELGYTDATKGEPKQWQD